MKPKEIEEEEVGVDDNQEREGINVHTERKTVIKFFIF